MNPNTYAKTIHQIVEDSIDLNLPDHKEVNLINFAKSLVVISQLNKKHSTVNYNKEFLSSLEENEKKEFLMQMQSLNNLLMSFFSNYHQSNSTS